MKLRTIFLLFLVVAAASCSKEDEESTKNPYNDPSLKPPVDSTDQFALDSSSFQFLYYKVFKPTCSNSGCHDGNFPPDFRTIYSSYNTLVNHDVIQNDLQESFKYRVEPYNLKKSLLWERLTRFMPNTSGIMPLAVEPDSDWPTDSAVYKDLIREWILSGAPDTYGNIPDEDNAKPQVIGILAFESGTTSNPLPRLGGGLSPISIPTNGPVDVWFAFDDDKTDVSNFKLTQVKSSYSLFDFGTALTYPLNPAGPLSGKDFYDNTVSFTHKASVDFTADTVGTYVYLRAYLRDDEQADTTEMPNAGTNDIIRSYFTLKVDTL